MLIPWLGLASFVLSLFNFYAGTGQHSINRRIIRVTAIVFRLVVVHKAEEKLLCVLLFYVYLTSSLSGRRGAHSEMQYGLRALCDGAKTQLCS